MEEAKEISLVNTIITHWESLGKIRAKNRYNVTNLKIGFRTIPQNKEEDNQRLQLEIENEIIEREEDVKWQYILDLIEHQEQMMSTEDQDYSSLYFISSKKQGLKSPNFDKEGERKIILERVSRNRRYPGEAIVVPEIMKIEITKESELPAVSLQYSITDIIRLRLNEENKLVYLVIT